MRRVAPVIFLVGLAACGGQRPVEQSDWERAHLAETWQEEETPPPAYPAPADLIEFKVVEAGGFRFFVDGSTLAVGKDGIVRYVLVARSPEGADNVTFEGLRCATRESRIYAVGHADRSWAGRPGPWRPISASGAAPWRLVLQRDYFCRGKEPIADRAAGLRALREGGWDSMREGGA